MQPRNIFHKYDYLKEFNINYIDNYTNENFCNLNMMSERCHIELIIIKNI